MDIGSISDFWILNSNLLNLNQNRIWIWMLQLAAACCSLLVTLRRHVERKISVETSHDITKYSENQLSSTVAHEHIWGVWGWGIRISRFIMCAVFESSKTQFSKPLAKGQLSRIGGWEVMNLCGWSIYRGYEQYGFNLLQQTTSGEMIVSSCGFDSALID